MVFGSFQHITKAGQKRRGAASQASIIIIETVCATYSWQTIMASSSSSAAANMRDLQRVTLAYTFRRGLYQTAAEKCDEWMSRQRADPILTYWRHVAIGLAGMYVCSYVCMYVGLFLFVS